jgi:hypothetical protein
LRVKIKTSIGQALQAAAEWGEQAQTSATADNTFGNENLILSLFFLNHFQKSFLIMH